MLTGMGSETCTRIDTVIVHPTPQVDRCFLLNLTDAFTRQFQSSGQHFQPFRFAGAQSESTRQRLAFALVEFTQAVFEQRSTS